MDDDLFDLDGLQPQPNIDDIEDIEVDLPNLLRLGDNDRYERLGDMNHHNNNNNNNVHSHHISLATLVQATDGSDETFWKEFFFKLKRNQYMGDYSFFENRQERLLTIMLSDSQKIEAFAEAAKVNLSMKSISLDVSFRFQNQIDTDSWMGNEEYYRRWRRIGQGIGNLKGLRELQINAGGYLHHHNEPDYVALASVLKGIDQMEQLVIKLDLFENDDMAFAKELHNCVWLREVQLKGYTEVSPMEVIAKELEKVPNLESFETSNCYNQLIPCRTLPDQLFQLLKKPHLKQFSLERCNLTEHQCQLLKNVLEQTKATTLNLQYSRFLGNGGKTIMKSLSNNTSIAELTLSTGSLTRETCEAFATSLKANTSMTDLTIVTEEEEWAPDQNVFDTTLLECIFTSIKAHLTLRYLNIGDLDHWSEGVVKQFRDALESPECKVEELWLSSRNDASAVWERLTPFLKNNRSLKILRLIAAVGHKGVIATASSLSENNTLQSLEVCPCARFDYEHAEHDNIDHEPSEKDFISARTVEALGKNDTLQRLVIDCCHTHRMKDSCKEGSEQLLKALRRNFGIKGNELAWQRDHDLRKPVEAIARLNGAGRRYLLEDPSSKKCCLNVLANVTDDIDALFIHLQENPSVF